MYLLDVCYITEKGCCYNVSGILLYKDEGLRWLPMIVEETNKSQRYHSPVDHHPKRFHHA